MKRYDLRGHKENFIPRMIELMKSEIQEGENGIFLFEIGDFSSVQAVADVIKENNWRLMNSLKFNEVDWTVVIKKEQAPVDELQKIEEEEEATE
jgi:NADH-quinone oxidoreductase subunit E